MSRINTLIATILLMAALAARADEIYLKNGTALRGLIIRAGDLEVRYRPEGQSIDHIVPRDQVERISYDKKEAVNCWPDRIIMIDGYEIRGRVLNITERSIGYIPENAASEQIIERTLAQRVVFGDGRVVVIQAEPPPPAEWDETTEKQAPPTPRRRFVPQVPTTL
ncbi:MAG: hypothetical protein JXA20_06330 [Spirochaetes bacterium]|nr:hypothetical protein [Spirochaetota bacterium]